MAFGQHITVGARPPDLSIAGPAQLVQVGNTALDINGMHVYGPLRPQLTMGPSSATRPRPPSSTP